jgi:hypothetical protein
MSKKVEYTPDIEFEWCIQKSQPQQKQSFLQKLASTAH